MDNPLVSCIVVSYNQSAYIADSLNSILNQTYKNWELIVADDASKDGSADHIKEWLLQHNVKATALYHSKNVGLCNTLNECLRHCNGKYIKFLAGDDLIMPELVAESVATLESLDESYGLVYSNAQVIDKTNQVQDEYLIPPDRTMHEGWVRDELYKGNFVPVLSVLIKKSVYDQLGGYDPHILVEDFDLWLRMSTHYKFAVIQKVLSYYRVHGDNISLNYNVFDDIARILIKYDPKGEKRTEVRKVVIDRYNYGNMSEQLKKAYLTYPGRTSWLAFSIRYNVPYTVFRVFDKFWNVK